MKSLLSISLLSVLLSVCNNKPDTSATEEPSEAPVEAKIDASSLLEENAIIEAAEPAIDAAVDEAETKPASTKPKVEGELPKPTETNIIEHGAPDKSRNDSVKATKTKGKF